MHHLPVIEMTPKVVTDGVVWSDCSGGHTLHTCPCHLSNQTPHIACGSAADSSNTGKAHDQEGAGLNSPILKV